MRVVLDTNVIVSSVIATTGTPALLVGHWQRRTFEMITSEEILHEVETALLYPHVQKLHHRTAGDIANLVDDFRRNGTVILITDVPAVVLADPKDDIFVPCAVQGEADYIVSGDRHLLNLGEFRGIPVLRPIEFLATLDA